MIEAIDLEVIDKGNCTEKHPVPLLFVHGVAHAAWCWDEHFLDFFADRGFRSVALSLRGHGASHAGKPFRACSAADYVEDMVSVIDNLPRVPVMIGHSQGGFVVQKYLESHDAPAAVLVASTPPQGIAASLLRTTPHSVGMLMRHLWRGVTALPLGKPWSAAAVTEAVVRDMFFCHLTPDAVVHRCVERLKMGMSARAFLDMMFLNLPKPHLVTTPLLVLGAQYDHGLTARQLHATARAYDTDAVIFPGMGHDMMLEPGWRAVARRISAWLGDQGL